MYRLIAIDLDDTLLREDGDVSEENIRAIEKARQADVKIVLCSGRPSRGMHRTIEKIGINEEGEYYISFNGALIRNCYDHEKLYEATLEKVECDEIIDYARQAELALQLYVDDVMYVEKVTERTEEYEILTGVEAIKVTDLKEYTHQGVLKVLINDEPELLKSLYNKIEPIMNNRLHVFFSRDHLLEFISLKTNKGLAVLELAKRLKISKDEIIAVGDSYNDKYMIEMVGLGVTVSNGRQAIKDIAGYVTSRSNNEHAIEEVIERFIFHGEIN